MAPDPSDDRTRPQVRTGVPPPAAVNPHWQHKARTAPSLEDYVAGILAGDRVMLGRAITLVESKRSDHQQLGQQIIERCLPQAGPSVRIGITGVPGVGKSTFIEAFGLQLLAAGKRLAVLAVDPSSQRTKGSILGDKTRMPQLATAQEAFIRPSPAGDSLGGVARKSRETIMLCEAAGYDTILVETVGVGQSEVAVHAMVDFFLLLLIPGAGDELQGIKRGIVEMADLLAVNKADGDNIPRAKRAQAEYRNALHLFPPTPSGWTPPVVTCSALSGEGLGDIQTQLQQYLELVKNNGYFDQRRSEQATYWLHQAIEQQLGDLFLAHPSVKKAYPQLEQAVLRGDISAFQAAEQLITLFRQEK
ncbi:MAG: methylmalonyl Co-A mutase-associated GTPase MeaB [Lewinellaceae bacterium]|nr:methylmalonyl Co-A mutase-associated GTPase MeaB [Lewinellaceae bacterium]